MKKSINAVRKTYAPQQNSDINRRVVTKTMPAQNSTTTIPRILKQKPACQKCFVCDGDIETRGFPLIMASTLSSKTSLPNKIGKLMGDGFMVIVSMDDVICKRCSSLFNHMDRLETDLERVQNTLSGYLKVKYKISDDDIERPPAKMIKLDQSDDLDNLLDGNNSSQEIESQLSNMFGSPIHITQKDDRSKPTKMYKCVACDFKTTDLTQFQPHYDKCPKKHRLKDSEHIGLKALEAQGAVAKVEIKKFACNVCNFKISDKQVFEEHMKKHVTLRPFKCRVCAQRFENREQATIHARTHQPDFFKCGICNISFHKRDLLVKHLESHVGDSAKTNSTTVTTASSTISTQRLLQASIEEALRDTANENESTVKATLENKPIEFYTCSTCSLTFLQESIYTQHMKQHRTDIKKPTGQSLIRQDVRTTNASILNSQTTELRDGDLESIFEKMHSDKTETPVVVTTASSNALEQVTFNITIPQDGEALDPEQQITANTIRKHENVLIFKCETCNEAYGDNDHLKIHYITSGHGPSHSPPIPIDMPNLDEPEGEHKDSKSEPDVSNTNSGDKMETAEANNSDAAGEKSVNLSPPDEDHRTESNTDPVPMEIEDMNSEQQESGEIKLMLDSDNQLITSDGQILQLDNHILTDADGNQIITSSDGQILTVQGADNEQLQQLLQSVGVVVQQEEEGDEEHMQMQLDGSQMIIVQTDSGEVQMTLEQAQEAGIDLSQLMAKDDSDLAEGEEKTMAFNLDELCQLQEGENTEQPETITDEIENESK